MAFLDPSEAREAVAGVLKTASNELADYYDGIIPASHAYAYGQVVARLRARGHTDAEITAWETATGLGSAFERRILIEEALSRGGMLGAYDDKFLKHFRRAKAELDVLTLVS